ncbi:hypothetical protein N665_1443s0003 [Sinapis alba]|nr:hypothetical protein N665_1443s0003 [Sinapis alba]
MLEMNKLLKRPMLDGQTFTVDEDDALERAPESQTDDPWSELKGPKIKLKFLDTGLRYAFLGPNSTYPVIVNFKLNNVETALLLCELKKYRRALGLANHPYYCFVDDYSGFFQIPIHPDDQEKKTFTCPYEIFAYMRMPFGCCNGVKRNTWSEKMPLHGPQRDCPWSQDFGARRFIKDFSKISRPLTELRCKETKFEFDDDCLAAIHTIKGALISALIVQPPNWDLPFEIMTYASDFAVGTVLGQRKDKNLHVIYYASMILDEAQCRYATTEKELLAIVFAFEKFRSYLVGSKVVVHTDHAALRYLLNHLSIMKIDEETTPNDTLLVEQVYSVDLSRPTARLLPTDCSKNQEHSVAAIKKRYPHLPWFAEITNFLAAEKEPMKITGNEKRKFLKNARHYFWDEPYLYWHCKDGVFRNCMAEAEIPGILNQCHVSSYAGHFATFKIVSKMLQARLWWITMF